jgi:hypothetical protein
MEVQKIVGIKSRQYLSKYIKEKYLMAIEIGSNEGKRYAIKGAWIESFLERKKLGLLKKKKYTQLELKLILKRCLEYCEKNNITTLKELIERINRL